LGNISSDKNNNSIINGPDNVNKLMKKGAVVNNIKGENRYPYKSTLNHGYEESAVK